MSLSQRFVINSEQSRLAKRHRRNVFKAKIKAKLVTMLHLATIFVVCFVGLGLAGFGGK